MQPIQDLLNRIHWDPHFGEGRFELAFVDHRVPGLVRLAFDKLCFAPGDHYFFQYFDEEGVVHNVPFHRIKAVYKNGELIWQRKH
jgi:uncharacterized protein (UPF0248 family)